MGDGGKVGTDSFEIRPENLAASRVSNSRSASMHTLGHLGSLNKLWKTNASRNWFSGMSTHQRMVGIGKAELKSADHSMS